MFKHVMLGASLAVLSHAALAGTEQADIAERYADVQHCIERTLGKHWEDRYRIELTVNRWGAVEATGASIESAPSAVRMTDLRCRRELALAGRPRP